MATKPNKRAKRAAARTAYAERWGIANAQRPKRLSRADVERARRASDVAFDNALAEYDRQHAEPAAGNRNE